MRDLRTGDLVPHSLNGQELRVQDVGYRDCELWRVPRRPADADGQVPDLLLELRRERATQDEHIATLEREGRAHV